MTGFILDFIFEIRFYV